MKRLVVIAPGLNGYDGWEQLLARLAKEPSLEDSYWSQYDHHKRGWKSGGNLDQLARELCAHIDQQWVARGPFDDVILVGHSMGGLLVRMAFLLGAEAQSLFGAPRWAERVSRIILFAGLSRGIDTSRTLLLRFGSWSGRWFVPSKWQRLVSQLFRGSSTITNLRIRWIRRMAQHGAKAPVVVQFVGTLDEIVRREDSVDIEQFADSYYVSIPDAGHEDLYRLDQGNDPEARYAMLRDAFVHDHPEKGEARSIAGPSSVVFVLHGIRANNRTWVDQTIALIESKWPKVQAIGPRYEYFSALSFAIKPMRRKNLRWFQDAYTEALARNPQALFNFIGHSNGTYLFGESLLAIPGMRFEHAALAGCVLPEDYNWNELLARGQIKSIRVDGGRYDWPVAVLCNMLRSIGMKDVGTGGFQGFTNFKVPENKHEFFWHPGAHAAALTAANLEALAEFAVTGKRPPKPTGLTDEAKWFAFVSRVAKIASLILALILALVFMVIRVSGGTTEDSVLVVVFIVTGIALLLHLI